MKYWLFKSEPESYSIDHLKKEKKCEWDGVRNYQARNFMTKEMQVGDLGLFYHSNTKIPGAVGTLKISRKAQVDKTAFDPKSPYYAPKATKEKPIWECVQVQFQSKFSQIVSLEQMRKEKKLEAMKLLQKGNRLSILPLTKAQFEYIVKLGAS